MRLVQFRDRDGRRGVAVSDGAHARRLREVETVYELALEAIETRKTLAALVPSYLGPESDKKDRVDLDATEREGRLLPPLEHPVPTRCWITGTGLTHVGSAQARDRMHAGGDESDSLKLFRAGLEGGKPAPGAVGAEPEWFFRGNGATLVGAGQPLGLPDFARDGGEEPELVGLYVISDDGTPCRIGWALGNEYTDHALERTNYLYLARAKLRDTAVGPELLLGDLPPEIDGLSRIRRDDQVIWERPFATGEARMSHSLANLEYHHFKYPMFRRPGDVHLHLFGTGTMSAADGVQTAPGDVFEISAPLFGRPLRNPLTRVAWAPPPLRVL